MRFEDLQRLREVVWRVHFKLLPDTPYDPVEADRLIEALGPEISESMIEKLVDERKSP